MARIPLHGLIRNIIGADISDIDNEADLKEVIKKLRETPDFELKVKA